MNVGGGSLFDLEATLTIDTSGYEDSISQAISDAQELSSSLSDVDATVSVDADIDDALDEVDSISDACDDLDGKDVDVSIDASVDGGDEVDDMADSVSDLAENGDVTVDVDADVSGSDDVDTLSGAIDGIDDAAGTAKSGISGIGDTIASSLGGNALSVISNLYNALSGLVTSITGEGDAIDKGSQRLQMTTQQYQQWSYIMQLCGSDVDNLKRLMNKLIDPTTSVTDGLKGLSLPDDFANMDTASKFEAVITALQGIEDPAKRAEAAFAVFGNQWTTISALLNSSPDDVSAWKETADAFSMSSDMVKDSANYQDALTTLQTAWSGFASAMLEQSGIVTTITELANGLSSFAQSLAADGLQEKIDGITTSFGNMIGELNGKESTITAIINAMDALGDPTQLTEEGIAQYQALYEKLLSICPGLADQFGTVASATQGFTDKLRENTAELMANAKEQALAQAAADRLQAVVDAQSNAFDKGVEATIANSKAQQAMSDAQQATQQYMSLATDAQKEYAQGFIDSETGILNYRAMMESLGEAQSTQEVGLDQSAVDSFDQYATAAQEAATAQAEFNAAQAEVDAATSSYDEWYNAISQIAGIDTVATSADAAASSIDGVNTSLSTMNTAGSAASTTASTVSTAMSTVGSSVSDAASTVSSAVGEMDLSEAGEGADDAADKLSQFASKAKTSMTSAKSAVTSAASAIASKLSSIKDKKVTVTIEQKYITTGNKVTDKSVPSIVDRGIDTLYTSEARSVASTGTLASRDIDTASIASAIADAVSNVHISLYVGDAELAAATSKATARQTAIRTAQVSSGYGMGAV